MISKRIPEKYDVDGVQLMAAIRSVVGPNVTVSIKGRIVEINGTLTAPQAAALKAAVLPLLTEIDDITV